MWDLFTRCNHHFFFWRFYKTIVSFFGENPGYFRGKLSSIIAAFSIKYWFKDIHQLHSQCPFFGYWAILCCPFFLVLTLMCFYFYLASLVDSVLCFFFFWGSMFYALTVFGTDHTVRHRKQDRSTESFQHLKSADHALLQSMQGYPSVLVLPFILHLAFMTFTALFVMHVQVKLLLLPPLLCFSLKSIPRPSTFEDALHIYDCLFCFIWCLVEKI